MRRVLLVLSVTALMAVMMVAMAAHAFANGPGTGGCVKYLYDQFGSHKYAGQVCAASIQD